MQTMWCVCVCGVCKPCVCARRVFVCVCVWRGCARHVVCLCVVCVSRVCLVCTPCLCVCVCVSGGACV